jgi:RNA polymerase sigma-70 factor (ECF subfamily)
VNNKGFRVPAQNTEDIKLIKRCQQGEISAFETLYYNYGEMLFRIAIRMLKQKEDAEDAVQTTFVKLYHGIGKYRFQSKFSTYLIRIVMNVCFDQLKKRKRMSGEPITEKASTNQGNLDLRLELDKAIHTLPPQQKACFSLFAIEDRPQEEIADILNITLGGVKSNIFQAKAKLKAILSK